MGKLLRVADKVMMVWLLVFLGAAIPLSFGHALTPLSWLVGMVSLVAGFGTVLVAVPPVLYLAMISAHRTLWLLLWTFGKEVQLKVLWDPHQIPCINVYDRDKG